MDNKDYFIRTSGKGEFQTFHLINVIDFSLIDVFFNSEEEAKHYAHKYCLGIVEYKDAEIENV